MAKPNDDESKLIALLSKVLSEHFRTVSELLLKILSLVRKNENNSSTQHHTTMAKLSELEGILTTIGDTLDKAQAEIIAAIAKLKETDPDLSAGGEAAVARLAAVAKALDDLNPDEA